MGDVAGISDLAPAESVRVNRVAGKFDLCRLRLYLRPIGQLLFQCMEFFGQLMEPIELRTDHLHLVTVHRSEHLDHHGHSLLKLVKHLLLHQAKLIDERHQQRVGQLQSGPS